MMVYMPSPSQLRHIVMRLGLALVFMIFGVWEILSPLHWAGYLPVFATLGHPVTVITLHGIVLFILGACILLGIYLRITSVLSSLMLLAIIASLAIVSGYLSLIVRDAALLCLTVSIALDNERYMALTK